MKIIIVFSMFLASCASTHVMTKEEQAVRVERGSYSLEGCVVKGALKEDIPQYFGADSYYIDHAGDALRKAAIKLGANTVIMTKSGTVGETALGIAYFCK